MSSTQDTKLQDITIALAGIFQAATLVDKLARTGYLAKDKLGVSVHSLLAQDPETTLSTFGTLADLSEGLDILVMCLDGIPKDRAHQSLRYALGIFHLQNKLSKNSDLLSIISSRLQQVRVQAQHFQPTHDNVVANLASLYVDTIGKFRYRIHVAGDATYLQQERVAAQIRTLLFGGVRAAILWRQVGGKRLQLLLQRKQLLACARELLDASRRSTN